MFIGKKEKRFINMHVFLSCKRIISERSGTMKKQMKAGPQKPNHKKMILSFIVVAIAVSAMIILQVVKRPKEIDITPYQAITNENTKNSDVKVNLASESTEGMGGIPVFLMKYDELANANLFNNADHSIKDGVVLAGRFSKDNDDNLMSEEMVKDNVARVEAALGLTPEQRRISIDDAIAKSKSEYQERYYKEEFSANREFQDVRVTYDNGLEVVISDFNVRVFSIPTRALTYTTQGVVFQDLPYKTRDEAIAFAKHSIESISGKEYVLVEEDELHYSVGDGFSESRELRVGENSYFKPIDDDGSPLAKLDYMSFYVSEDLEHVSFNMPAYPVQEYVATYPLITYETALRQVEEGNHFTYLDNGKDEKITREDILASEFVYFHAGYTGQYTLPYYKFIVKAPYPYLREDDETSGLVNTYEVYVPAIKVEDIYANWTFLK